eukprot:scaffold6986_cov23-Prasinocladus_malaysianus.AAC.1
MYIFHKATNKRPNSWLQDARHCLSEKTNKKTADDSMGTQNELNSATDLRPLATHDICHIKHTKHTNDRYSPPTTCDMHKGIGIPHRSLKGQGTRAELHREGLKQYQRTSSRGKCRGYTRQCQYGNVTCSQ